MGGARQAPIPAAPRMRRRGFVRRSGPRRRRACDDGQARAPAVIICRRVRGGALDRFVAFASMLKANGNLALVRTLAALLLLNSVFWLIWAITTVTLYAIPFGSFGYTLGTLLVFSLQLFLIYYTDTHFVQRSLRKENLLHLD